MYLDYWNLKEKPFENTPDCRFLYLSRNHRESLQKLSFAISGEKGQHNTPEQFPLCRTNIQVHNAAQAMKPIGNFRQIRIRILLKVSITNGKHREKRLQRDWVTIGSTIKALDCQ